MLDTETDGPTPGRYSMLSCGLIVVDRKLDKTFYGEFLPISPHYQPEALAVNGITREKAMTFPKAEETLAKLLVFVTSNTEKGSRSMLISDNNGFDAMFLSWYLYEFLGVNPFGHSSTNLGSLYKGLVRNMKKNFKHLRKTKHDHNPVNDCKGNCEALFYMIDVLGLNFTL